MEEINAIEKELEAIRHNYIGRVSIKLFYFVTISYFIVERIIEIRKKKQHVII